MTQAEYLNVDLELESASDRSPLVEHWGEQVFVLFQDRVDETYRLAFETEFAEPTDPPTTDHTNDADDCIREFLSLIAALPAPLRGLWDGCHSRVFDIGVIAGTEPRVFIQMLSTSTLQAMAAVGGTVRFTMYPPPQENGGADAGAPGNER